MKRDEERLGRICKTLREKRIDAFVCALPSNVLLLSGYWPVVGPSIAIVTRDGKIILIVPRDEKSLAENGWADEVLTFAHGSLEKIGNVIDNLQAPLIETITRLNLFNDGVLGCEDKAEFQPASYAAMYFPDLTFHKLLQETFPQTQIVSADKMFSGFRARLTPGEIERVRISCRIAERAFLYGAKWLGSTGHWPVPSGDSPLGTETTRELFQTPLSGSNVSPVSSGQWPDGTGGSPVPPIANLEHGLTETDVAHFFRAPLTKLPENVHRADGFVYCMSGINSFEAFASFQRSRSRKIQNGDLVLIHCNSYADGFWTDITRTFCVGEPNGQQRKMFEAIFDAREAAIAAVHPGIPASDVDNAAREKLKEHGFDEEFRHATGHGVGFAAINHNAPPRIHPKSRDILETGMVFNIEPGIYIEGIGGMRHCDMVVVTDNGAEILTPFQSGIDDLILSGKGTEFVSL